MFVFPAFFRRHYIIKEAEAKRKFIEEPGEMKLLIVVDKLLTGFDAPPATYLYIDKSMHDHGLFQAKERGEALSRFRSKVQSLKASLSPFGLCHRYAVVPVVESSSCNALFS